MPLHAHEPEHDAAEMLSTRPQHTGATGAGAVPKLSLPDTAMDAQLAYSIVHDELLLDGSARLNLATFVTTWMDPLAEALIAECAPKNMIDRDEYPQTAEIERRCVNIIANLWHADGAEEATGCSTTGSSEACMLAGLALLRRWVHRREAAGLATDSPNLVLGANAQVCWEKFCRYFSVEARLVPVSRETPHLSAQGALEHCDENSIGVVAILGSTYDGSYEPVGEIASALDRLEAERNIDVPVHVDAASGGFVAPFLDPELEWDFRLARVVSINASGHKYGLVYPGVGWAVWRDRSALPDELVFDVAYLGGSMPTFTLNFSRPAAQVVAQYYNFLRLGRTGYTEVQAASRSTARWLSEEVAKLGPFALLGGGEGIPAFAFEIVEGNGFSVYDVSEALRTRGWVVPAYPMPPAIERVEVLRVVCRNGFSDDLASLFLADLAAAVGRLSTRGAGAPATSSFHH